MSPKNASSATRSTSSTKRSVKSAAKVDETIIAFSDDESHTEASDAKEAPSIASQEAAPSTDANQVVKQVEQSSSRVPLTETQKGYLKMRSVTHLMDTLINKYDGITQVEIFAYKTVKSIAFGRDQLTAEVFKVIPLRGKEQIKVTTSDLWELFKIRPKINLTAKYSIQGIQVVPGVADKDYDNMEGTLNSFIRISIPAVKYSINDGHYYNYKVGNVYGGKPKEQMCKALESFNTITTDKELHKKYRWNDESAKIDAIEVIDLSDDDEDDE